MAFFGVQKLSVDLPSDQIFDQRILYGSHLHIIFGGDADLLFLLVKCDLGFRLAKIVARQNCFFGDINRVVDLLEIDTADDIKGRHDSFLPDPAPQAASNIVVNRLVLLKTLIASFFRVSAGWLTWLSGCRFRPASARSTRSTRNPRYRSS